MPLQLFTGGVGLSGILSLIFTPAVYHLIYRPRSASLVAGTASAG